MMLRRTTSRLLAVVLVACSGGEGGSSSATSSGSASGAGGSVGDGGAVATQSAGGAGGSGGDATSAGGGGASASGGAPGAGGGGGAGAGGNAAGGRGPGVEGDPCSFGSPDACDTGLYCDAVGCGLGACAPILPTAAQTKTLAPVCGCDGITYFNDTVAQSKAMAVSHTGTCTSGEAVSCDKTTPCPSGLHCNAEVANAGACVPVPQASGACWGVPLSCGSAGASGRGCQSPASCFDVCALMQSQNPWYADATCP